MSLTFGPPAKGWPDFGGVKRSSTYLAGPMRGYERFNFPAFDEAQKHLEAEGWIVFSPAEMDRDKYGPEIEFASPAEISASFMHEALRRDINTLLAVDAIHLLEGWQDSSGANVEITVARAIGLEIYEQIDSAWARRA